MAQMSDLRFWIAYAEAATKLLDDDEDAIWQRRLFREQLANLHELVANNVTHEDVMRHARESLRVGWRDCGQDEVDEHWARVAPEDVRVGVVSDLQLVAPRVWIGSADTLTAAELLDQRDVQHVVFCTTSREEARFARPKASDSRTFQVVTLLDLQFEDGGANSVCSEFAQIAATLNARLATGDGALLLYCASGLSTSVAVCAALLMTRYKLPLHVVLPLIQAARSDIALSKHLHAKLQQLDTLNE